MAAPLCIYELLGREKVKKKQQLNTVNVEAWKSSHTTCKVLVIAETDLKKIRLAI